MCQRGTCPFSKPYKETAEIETGIAEKPVGPVSDVLNKFGR
jgi:hypothetical protein